MENIYNSDEAFDAFDFSKMELTNPVPMLGGNHFIKFLVNGGKPLYVQPPTCKSKQGVVKVGKKYYCDLMFTFENEHFVSWMENLETHCHKYIYNNRQKWFDNEMELHDVENYFTSPVKLYKSGTFYTVRANIQTVLDKPKIKIYNEDGEEVGYNAITNSGELMTILEMQGIRCSARSFQIDIEIKQMMVLKPNNLFDHCIFSPANKTVRTETREPETQSSSQMMIAETITESETVIDNNEHATTVDKLDDTKTNEVDADLGIFVKTDDGSDMLPQEINNIHLENTCTDTVVIGTDEIQEVVFNLDKLPESDKITLKNRNDVYYEMYREARRKAKYARELAMASYLEAKNIKNKYMLDDMDDSDESDLENDGENEYDE